MCGRMLVLSSEVVLVRPMVNSPLGMDAISTPLAQAKAVRAAMTRRILYEQVDDFVVRHHLRRAEDIDVTIGALRRCVGEFLLPINAQGRVQARVEIFRARLDLFIFPTGFDYLFP